MAAERLSMRTIREILRLKWACHRSNREIAQSCKIARSSVGECLTRAAAAGLAWPLPPALDDGTLEARLYRRPGRPAGQRPLPEWATIHQELKRPCVTLQLLWQEYKTAEPAGLQYSQFCVHYRQWAKTLDLCLRQKHRAGEKLFLDYAGESLWLTDPATGTRTPVALFVAVLGASNYTYAEASRAADLPAWTASHVCAFEYFGGVTAALIPDNHKSAVLHPDRYEPDLHPTYLDLAAHYGTTILPARPAAARDKGKVEQGGVHYVTRNCVAGRAFRDVHDANGHALRGCLETAGRRLHGTIKQQPLVLFETVERVALLPLPPTPWLPVTWKQAKLHPDCHVVFAGAYYSAPHRLIGQRLWVRATATQVQLFHEHALVATHLAARPGQRRTLHAHLPPDKVHFLLQTPRWCQEQAAAIGPTCAAFIAQLLGDRPLDRLRGAQGVLRLAQRYGAARLEAVCARAAAAGEIGT